VAPETSSPHIATMTNSTTAVRRVRNVLVNALNLITQPSLYK
jgi:hypothetical protein